MDKDIRKILREAEKQGFEVGYTERGHPVVRLNGRRVTTFSGTPGSPGGLRKGLGYMKAAGFQWPPE